MTNSAKWSGVLKQLRFDPFDTTGTIEVDYIRFVRNPDKTFLAANAETSDHDFVSDNAEISVTTDPGNASNHVYLVKTKAGRNWAYLRKNCVFEPGKTYQVEFDVKLAGKGSDVTGADPSVSTDVYANIRYLDSKGAIDHINGAQNGSMLARIKVSDGWKHVSFEYTIDANSTNRANDQFTIYSNPLGEEGVSYYIDNLYVMEM